MVAQLLGVVENEVDDAAIELPISNVEGIGELVAQVLALLRWLHVDRLEVGNLSWYFAVRVIGEAACEVRPDPFHL